ncbi:unnamed protein product [Dibothriocephalus latus]|uniref:Uncharacterized protein n=1 Tax=Dibothriocephalus latus TaxID=60516 RepID=A0A3P7LV55_DIBLA|nr:unnamed protein product [Dibothriocephalus latus]
MCANLLLSFFRPFSVRFSSIPQDVAVKAIHLFIRDETEYGLGHAKLLQLLKYCLKTYFTLNGTTYEQVKGTPMVSSNSRLIAEVVLQRLGRWFSTPQTEILGLVCRRHLRRN